MNFARFLRTNFLQNTSGWPFLFYNSCWLYTWQLYIAGNFQVVGSHWSGNKFIHISKGFYRFRFFFIFLIFFFFSKNVTQSICCTFSNQYFVFLHKFHIGCKCRYKLILIEKKYVCVIKNVWPLWSRHSKIAVFQEWIDEINWFFACWYKFRKAKKYLSDCWVGVVKNGGGFLGLGTLLYLKNEFMNWTGFLHADSDAIIFGYTDNPTLPIWL